MGFLEWLSVRRKRALAAKMLRDAMQEELQKELPEQTWQWKGRLNLSRAAPTEMIGSQNLAQVPGWLWHDLRHIVNPNQAIEMKFMQDSEHEYRFKPYIMDPSSTTFYIDIYRRPVQWKQLP